MVLILWTTKDQAFILISSLGINKLFYVASSSYPTIECPQKLALLLQHGSVSEIRQRFKARSATTIISTSQHSFVPKTPGAPTMQQVLFLRQNPIQESPETSRMSCHTTTPKILDKLILSLVFVPTKSHQQLLTFS